MDKKIFLTINLVKSNLAIVLSIIDKYLLEIQNSLLSVIVGIWFILYPYNYSAFPGTFKYIDVIPAYVIGIVYIFFGAMHLLALALGLPKLRKQVLLTKSALWAFLVIIILLANPYSLLAYFFMLFMIMTFITFLKTQILSNQKYRNV